MILCLSGWLQTAAEKVHSCITVHEFSASTSFMYVIHYWSGYTEWFCPVHGTCPFIYNISTLFWHSEDHASWYILI